MASSQCQVQVSVNGGAWQSGGIIAVPFGASISLRNIVASARSYQWELPDYGPSLGVPTGWASVGGVYTSYVASPPVVTIPASGPQSWGKYPLRLRINSNPLQYEQDGSLNPAFDPDWTDEATILSVPSPNAGMPGFCFGEATQFDTLRSWAGSVMANLRALDMAVGSAAAPYVHSVTNADFDFNSLTGGNTTAYRSFVYVNGLTASHTLKLPGAPFLGQQITAMVDSSCSSSNPLVVDPDGNTFIRQAVAGLSASTAAQLTMEHAYESATWVWNGSIWSMTAWVFASGAP